MHGAALVLVIVPFELVVGDLDGRDVIDHVPERVERVESIRAGAEIIGDDLCGGIEREAVRCPSGPLIAFGRPRVSRLIDHDAAPSGIAIGCPCALRASGGWLELVLRGPVAMGDDFMALECNDHREARAHPHSRRLSRAYARRRKWICAMGYIVAPVTIAARQAFSKLARSSAGESRTAADYGHLTRMGF